MLNAVLFREEYGREMIRAIAQASKGKKTIGFSSFYPNLRKLEKRVLSLHAIEAIQV